MIKSVVSVTTFPFCVSHGIMPTRWRRSVANLRRRFVNDMLSQHSCAMCVVLGWPPYFNAATPNGQQRFRGCLPQVQHDKKMQCPVSAARGSHKSVEMFRNSSAVSEFSGRCGGQWSDQIKPPSVFGGADVKHNMIRRCNVP